MVKAAQIFNPFLSGHTDAEIVNKLYLLVDRLTYVEHKHFTEESIAQVKKELPKVVKETDRYYDVHRIDYSLQFKTRM